MAAKTPLDAAIALTRAVSANSDHSARYRSLVCSLVRGETLDAEQIARAGDAVAVLGISEDTLVADVRALQEAAQCQAVAGMRPALNAELIRVNEEAVAFEAECVRRRAELEARRGNLFSQIQLADKASSRVAVLVTANPRLAS